jgi:uncharacterized protein
LTVKFSMLILIDGYNVIGPGAPPGRGQSADWLRHERQRLISVLASGLGEVLAHETTVVFDASSASPSELARLGLENRYQQMGLTIEFATEYREADERIVELIGEHSAPKRLTVVSSDHRIQVAARRRGALAVDSDAWLDRLTEGRLTLAVPWPPPPKAIFPGLSETAKSEKDGSAGGDVKHWLSEFGISEEESHSGESLDHPFPKGYGEDLL